MEYVLTDLTAGNAAQNRGGAKILEQCSSTGCQRSFYVPFSLVLRILTASPCSGTSVHSAPRRCGVHGADCRGSGKLASATLRRHSVSAVAAQTTGPTSLRLSRVRQRGQLGVLLNGLEFEPGFGAVTGAGPEDRQARSLSGRVARRPTQEPSKIESCVLVSKWPGGITFQLPRGRDVGPQSLLSCRACPCLLVAVGRLAGRWCFWRLCSWRWCFSLACGFGVSFSFPFAWAPTQVSSSMF